MKIVRIGMLLSAALIVGTASGVVAQTAEPTYKGDPSVYKVIFEDAKRVEFLQDGLECASGDQKRLRFHTPKMCPK